MYNLKPISTREKILANMAGKDYEVHPRSREEAFLVDIANKMKSRRAKRLQARSQSQPVKSEGTEKPEETSK